MEIFDDTLRGKGYGWAIEQGLVSADKAEEVAALHRLLDQHDAPFGDDCHNERVLGDPAWQLIVERAKRTQLGLAALLKDPAELSSLLDGSPLS